MTNNFLSRVFVCVYPVFIWNDIAKKYGKSGEFREKIRRGGLAMQGSSSIEGGGSNLMHTIVHFRSSSVRIFSFLIFLVEGQRVHWEGTSY